MSDVLSIVLLALIVLVILYGIGEEVLDIGFVPLLRLIGISAVALGLIYGLVRFIKWAWSS